MKVKDNKSPFSGLARRAGVVVTAAAAVAVLAVSPASASARVSLASAGPAVAAAAPMASVAQAVGFDAQMIQLVNRARAAVGAPALTQAKGLTQLSVWWSSRMESGATNYTLQHNANAWTMVTNYGASNRTSWGENVAWSSSIGTTAVQLFTAYMNSPDHKANILSRNYHYIGMGTVTGPHGLFNTTEFTNAVQPGQAVTSATPAPVKKPIAKPVPARAPVNGDFIRDATTKATYRLVGGAPVFVSSWAPFGGAKPVKIVTHAKLLSYPRYPANGTFVRAAGTHQYYRIAGGAPVYVSSWKAFGGPKAAVDVDPAAIARAGAAGYYTHLRATPADGTFVKSGTTGAVYRMAGGAPIYVASWAPFGGIKATVALDPAALSHSGRPGVWSHLKLYPVTVTYIKAAGAASIYKVAAGKPIRLTSWASVGGAKPYTIVHPLAISRAGRGGVYNHLKK